MSSDTMPAQIDEFVAKSRLLTGQEIKEREPWNTTVTADGIRHFAYGISDDNPLWLDSDYAANSRYGRLVAPPAFLISVLYPMLHGAPIEVPLTSLIGDLGYQWFQPILEGDTLQASAKQTDLFEAKDRGGRRLVYILAETTYRNQRDEVVGRALGTTVRIAQVGTDLLLDRSIYSYSEAELRKIHEAVYAETRTGNRLLTDDEVETGQSLPTLVRGPMTIGDLICWQAAIGPSYRAGALAYRDCLAAPHTAVKIPTVGWLVKYSQQHEDFTLTSQRGMPAPFDNGAMRFAWLSVLLTNWMGDNGFLKRLHIHINEPILYGDTNWYRATITKKVNSDNGTVITVKITGTNQFDLTTTIGEAEVLLLAGVAEPQVRVEVPSHTLQRLSEQPSTSSTRLTEAERHQLLVEWNDTNKVYPTDQCIHKMFEMQAEQTPDTIAVVFEDQLLTYKQLNERANQLAHFLQSLKVGPEDLVGICMERSLEMVVGILGILKAGGAYLPLDPEYPTERLAFMLKDAQVSILLTQERVLARLPEQTTKVVSLDANWETVAYHSETNLVSGVTAENLAYVLYTSGSTDTPKGVFITHSSLCLYINSIKTPLGIRADDVYLHTVSFSFSAAVRQLMLPLCLGSTLVVAGVEQRQDPIALFELIKKRQVTVWDTVPTFWRHCIDRLLRIENDTRTALLNNKLRLILTTGEALMWDTPKTWAHLIKHGARIINLYSQTESTGTVAFYPIPADLDNEAGIVPLGRPVENTQIYILDKHLQPVQIDTMGELYIGGSRLAKGYLNRPELTVKKFIPNPFSKEPDALLYNTGDLARYLPDGNIESLGRADHQVKIRGFRIELREIETALSHHLAVSETIVLDREDSSGNPRLVAYVIPRQGQVPTVSDLHSFLKKKLPSYMLPTVFVFLDNLPLTPHGKLDRQALPAPERVRPKLKEAYEAPRAPVEAELVEIYAELLELDLVGIHDNFFELGGHSLLATQLISRVQDLFHVELSLRSLFEASTVAGLVAKITENQIADTDYDETDRVLAELESLSDEEVEQLLAQKLTEE